ncbi:DsbA family protein [Sulfurovum sp.]|uniref:DsbA family protein n=1 Tax=Sulfurovum sp. TaxID=1969726 RepID=UPI0025E107DE|nr:DsbA family protein [Sulfurovum sp.]
MSLMSKLLTSALIATVALSANTEVNNKVLLNYIERNVVKNPQVEVKGIKILEKRELKDLPGWDIYLTSMHLVYHKKNIDAPEMIFVKDGLATSHLVNIKTGRDYRNEIKPTVPASMYNDAHLLFGNKDAKHKLLVFSDPECPFCRDVVPGIMKAAKENPQQIALYYYHLPLLRIHPVSGTLTRIMHVAQSEGKKDVVQKMYTLKINPRETDTKKIIAAVKKQTGYDITEDKIKSDEVTKALEADAKAAGRMMVTGTPTVYVDGKWDKMRNGYKKFIKN